MPPNVIQFYLFIYFKNMLQHKNLELLKFRMTTNRQTKQNNLIREKKTHNYYNFYYIFLLLL